MRCTETNLRSWLAPFLKNVAVPTQPDAPPTQFLSTNDAPPTQPDAPPTRLRAHNKVSLVSKAESTDSLRSSVSLPVQAAAPDKKPKQPGLPFDAEVESRKREILNALWPLVQPHYGRAYTKTAWSSTNAKVARSLAQCERTADECVTAWHSASERMGQPVRMLSIVRDELARGDVSGSVEHEQQERIDSLQSIVDLYDSGKVAAW